MQKSLAIFFLCAHLFGNTEFGQIFRLPRLFAHYQQHCEIRSISFLSFIAMHYGGDDGTSADDQQDNQLPCHTTAGDHTYLHAFSPAIHFVVEQTIASYDSPSRITFFTQAELLTGYQYGILQPPRA